MFWPDEIRVPKFDVLDESVELRPQEIRMARSLIDSLTDAFQPEEFHDDYRAALRSWSRRRSRVRRSPIPKRPNRLRWST
jgi:DNA end-binding protein Ku